MNTVTISLTVDLKVTQAAEKRAKELGLSLNAVVNILLKEFIVRGRALLQQQEADRKKGITPKQFKTADELVEYLYKKA